MKEKQKKIFILIFVIFLGFTVAARIAYGVSKIEVEVGNIEQLRISKSFESEGTVVQKGGVNISKIENQMVASIDVRVGEQVNNETPLFTIDINRLEELIQEKQNEISKIELSIARETNTKNQAAQNKNDTILRAEQDYGIANEKNTIKIELAYQQYERSVQEYNDYISAPDSFPEKSLEELEQMVNAAEQAYQDAVWEGEESLLATSRAVEDAKNIVVDNTAVEELIIDKNMKTEQLSKLELLKSDGGIIRSPISGIVTEISVVRGEVMSEGISMIIADETAPNQVEIVLDEETADQIQIGSKVCLTGEAKSGEMKTISDLIVNEIISDESGSSNIIVETECNDWKHGQKVRAEFIDESEIYSMCIPLSAIHTEQDRYFIYVAEEKKTAMGTENIAKRYDVEILDMGNQYAAIKSDAITGKTKIIVDSEKMLQEESKIRMVN